MNRKRKVTPIIALVAVSFILIGVILTSVGLSQGGKIYLKQLRVGPLSSISWSTNVGSHGDEKFSSSGNVKSIDIDADLGNVIIKKGAKFSIVTNNFDRNYLEFEDNNGNIKFRTNDNESNFIPIGIFNNSFERSITVTVPESCTDLKVNADLGDVRIHNLTIDNLDLKLDLGNLKAKNVYTKNGKMDLNAGKMTFDGDFSENLELSNDMGNIELNLDGAQTDYNYKLHTDLGNLRINHEKHHRLKENNGANRLLKADVNLGKIEINFN